MNNAKEEFELNGDFQQQTNQHTPSSPQMNHGAHEMLDVHEVLSGMIGGINQYVLFRDQVQDQELLSILDRQYSFMLDEYNITLECYKSGQDPTHPTKVYHMQTGNNVKYGITPGTPKAPIQSKSEINDGLIAGMFLGVHKAGATGKTTAALESTNPVVRRVLQDSIPNCIEMAYELSLYLNSRGIYQVPQFDSQTMNTLQNLYGQAQKSNNMPN